MANRYWVGGTGTWDATTTHWSATSGGAAGASAPTSADAVFIDTASGSPTITLTGALNCQSITTTGATCTLTSTGTLTVAGIITLSATTTWSATGLLTIGAFSTITAGSTTFNCSITSAFSVTLGANLTLGTTNTFTITANLIFSNFTLSTGLFVSTSGTRQFQFLSSGNIIITGSGTTVFNVVGTSLTYIGTPTVNIQTGGFLSNTSISVTSFTETNALNFNVSGSAGNTFSVAPASVFKSLTFTSFTSTWSPNTTTATFYGNLTLTSGMTFNTGTGLWTFAATSGTQTITSAGKTLGPITQNGVGGTVALGDALTITSSTTGLYTLTNGTLNLANFTLSCGGFSSNNSNTRAIQFGTGNITTTSTGTAFVFVGTSFTYTGTPTVNISNNSATATTLTATSFTETNAFNFNVTTGTYALAVTTASFFKSLNFTGYTGTWAPSTATATFYGSLTLVSGMTFTTGTGVFTFANTSGTATITSGTKTLGPITQSGAGGTVALAANTTLATTATYTFTSGTLDLTNAGAGNYTLSTGLFSSANSNNRNITFGTGNITTTGSGTVWNVTPNSGTLLYSGTPTVNISNNSATATTVTNTGATAGTGDFNFNFTTGTYALTLTTAGTFGDLNFTGFTGSWTPGASTYTVFGSLTLVSGMTYNGASSTWTFGSTSTGKTITSASKILSDNQITFDGVGGGWTIQDAYNNSGNTTLTNGTLNTNGQTITTRGFTYAATGTATLTLGASTVNVGQGWAFSTTTGLTFNVGTSTIAMGTIANFAGGGLTYNNVTFSPSGSGTIPITGANTFANLSLYGSSGTQIIYTFAANQTITSGGLFYVAGNAGNQRIFLQSSVAGTQRTIIATNITLTDVDFKDIVAAGTTPWTGTRLGNGGNNLNITFTTAKTVYWNLTGSQNWSANGWAATSGGTPATSNFPLMQDTAVFDNTGAATTVTFDTSYNIGTVNMSARTTAMTLNTGTFPLTVYGSWTNGTGVTLSGTGSITFAGTSSQTITGNGVSFTQPLIISCGTGTYTLGSALTTTSTLTLTQGTLTQGAGSYIVTCLTFSSTGSLTRTFNCNGCYMTGNNTTVNTVTGSNFNSTALAWYYTYAGSTGTRTVNCIFSLGDHLVPSGSDTFTFTSGNSPSGIHFTGFTGIWTNVAVTTQVLEIQSSSSTMTVGAGANTLAFNLASNQSIFTSTKTLDFPVSFTGAGILTLGDALTLGSTRTFTLTGGTLNLNNLTLSCGLFSATVTNTRAIQFGTGNITTTGSGTAWNVVGTNLTYTGTPTVNISNNSATATTVTATSFTITNYFNFNITVGTYALTLTTAATVGNLNFTGFTGTWAPSTATATIYGSLTLVSGMTFTTGTGLWTFAATSGTQTITSAGKTLYSITQNGLGGKVSFAASGSSVSMSGTYTLTNGQLDITLISALVCASFVSTSGIRSIGFGASGFINTLGSGTALNVAAGTGAFGYTGSGLVIIGNNSASNATITMTGATATNALNVTVNAGTYALTMTNLNTLGNLNFTGFTGSLILSNLITLFGSLVLVSGMTFTANNQITFAATSTGKTITTAGQSMGLVVFDGTGGGWTFQDAFNTSNSIQLYTGSLNTNGKTVTVGNFFQYLGSTSATLTLGASNINIGIGWAFSIVSGLTFNCGTSLITIAASGNLSGGGQTYYNVSFSGGGSISSANTFNNLTFISPTVPGIYICTIDSNQTINGTLLVSGGTSSQRVFLQSSVIGTQQTITATAVSLTDVDFKDIVAAGTTPWTGTRLGNGGNNLNITFTTAKTVYWNLAGTQNWSANGWAATSGGTPATSNFPLMQDTAVFDNAGSAGTITFDTSIGTVNMSARTTAMTLTTSSNNISVYGNWTNGTGVTLSGTGSLWFSGTSQTITGNGSTFGMPVLILTSGTVALGSAITTTNFGIASGTLNITGYTLTCQTFNSNYTNVRGITNTGGTGSVSITGNATTVCDMTTSTNSTFSDPVNFNYTYSGATGTRTVASQIGGGISHNFTAGTDTVVFTTTGNTYVSNINFTGFSGTWTNSIITLFGNLTTSAGMTIGAGTNTVTFNSYGTSIITSNNKTFDFPITINGNSGTTGTAINGALTMGSTRTLALTQGYLDLTNGGAGNYTLSTGVFNSGNSNTRSVVFGTGNITTTNSGTVFIATGSGFTFTGTPKVNISNNSATATTVTATGFTEAGALDFNFTTGTYALTLTTAATVGDLNFTGFTGTWAPSTATATIYGSLTLVSGMTFTTGTGLWTFAATSGTQTITSAGKTLYSITQNGIGGTVALGANLAMSSGATYTLTNGTLALGSFTLTGPTTGITITSGASAILTSGTTQSIPITHTSGALKLGSNFTTTGTYTFTAGVIDLTNGSIGNYALSVGTFSSANSNTRSVVFGTGNITTTGTGTVFNATGSGFTFTGTPTVNISNNSATATTVTATGFTEAGSLDFNFTTGTYTLTLTTAATVGNLNFTGYTGTWAGGTNTAIIYGNLTLVSGMTISGTGIYTFAATSGTQLITCGGKTITNPITINNSGSSFQLQDTFSQSGAVVLTAGAININSQTNTFGSITLTGTPAVTITNGPIRFTSVTHSSGTVTLSSAGFPLALISTGTYTFSLGTLDVSSYSLSTGLFSSSNPGTRVIAFGTNSITTTGSGTAFNVTGTGLTYTGTPTVNISNNSATATTVTAVSFTEIKAFDFNFTTGTYALTLTTNANVRSLNFTGFTGTWAGGTNIALIYGNLTLVSGMTISGTGIYTLGATSGTQTITSGGKTITNPITQDGVGGTVALGDALTITSSTTGIYTLTNGTLNLANFTLSAGGFNSNNSNTRVIQFGTGNITTTSTGTAWNFTASGFTYTGTPTVNISNNSATATTVTMTGATPTNALNFNFTTGTYTLTLTNAATVGAMNFTGFTGTWAGSTNTATIFGNLTLVSGMGYTGTGAYTLASSNASQILKVTTAGKTITTPITIQNVTGSTSVQLQDNFTSSSTLTLAGGTFDWNSKTVTGFTTLTINQIANTTTGIINNAASATYTFTSITHTAGSFTLTSTAPIATSGAYTFTAGTLILGNTTLSVVSFSSANSNTRVIQFGTGNITTTGTGTVFNATGSGFTFTGTPKVNISNNSATATTVTATGFTEAGALDFNFTTGTYALTLTNNATVGDLNFTGYTGTWAPGTTGATIYGSLTLVSGMTFTTGTGTWTLAATSGTQTINSGGKTLYTINQSGVGGTVALGSNLIMGSTSTYNLNDGTLNLGSFTLTGTTNGISASGSYEGSPTLIASATQSIQIQHGRGLFKLGSNITTTGVFSFGNTGFNTTVLDLTNGGTGNYTLTVGSVSSNTGFTRVIQFGTGAITTTGTGTVWEFSTATGFSFTGTPTVNINNNTSTAITINQGGAAGGSSAIAVNFNFINGTYALAINSGYGSAYVGGLNFTGFAGSWAPGTTVFHFYGLGLILVPTMTFTSPTAVWYWSNTSTSTISTGSSQLLYGIIQDGGGTVTLGSNLTLSTGASYTLTSGTFDANNYNFTFLGGTFSSNNSNVRSVLMGSGTWTINCSGASTSAWDFGTTTSNLTLTPSTSTIIINHTSSLTVSFAGGGQTYNNLTLAGTGTKFAINGANTFNVFGSQVQSTTTIVFDASTTNTFTNFMAGGGAAGLGLISSTPGTTTTLSQSTGTVSVSNISTTDITATGGATWNAYYGTLGSNTTGWTNNNAPGLRVYWVGGSGNWTGGGNMNWSLTSGGAPTGVSPVSSNVSAHIDANSGSPTVTLLGSTSCLYFNTTGATCTIAGTGTLSMYYGIYSAGCNFTLSSTTTWTGTGLLDLAILGTFSAPATTFSCSINLYSNVTSGATLQSNITLGSTNTFTITGNTIDISSYTISTGLFAITGSGTTLRNTGGGSITVTGNNNTVVNIVNTAAFNSASTTFNLIYSGATGTRTISQLSSNALAPTFNISAGSDAFAVASASYMHTLDFTGFTGTWAPGTATATFYGSLTLVSGMTFTTGTGLWTFAATSGTQTITSAGKTLYSITQNGVGGTVTLSDALTTTTYTLTNGALDLTNGGVGNYTLTCTTSFSSNNSNTRSIAFGTGNITLTGNNATIWTTSTGTGMTFTGTPTVNCTYSGSTGTRTFQTGITLTTYPDVNVSAGSDIFNIASANNLNLTGFSGTFSNTARSIFGNLIISSGMTCTAGANATTFAATSGTQQITTNGNTTLDFPISQNGVGGTVQLQDALTIGSTRAYTLTNGTLDLNSKVLSTGLFSSTNSNTRSIAFGTGNVTVTGSAATVYSTAQATGFTYTGTPNVNFTYSGSTGTRTISHGSTGGATETNTPNFNISAGSDTVNLSSTSYVKNLNFTGFTGTLAAANRFIYGSLTISSGMILPASANVAIFAATSGTQQITTAGQTIDFPLQFNGIGGTWAFQDALTQGSTRAFNITNGTVKFKSGTTNIVGSFTTSGNNLKYLASTISGTQATISQASGTVIVNYLAIKDSNATGGALWQAYFTNNNVDGGNNTGWSFAAALGNFLMMFF